MISTLVGIKRITFLIFAFFSFFKPCSYFQQLIMPKRSSASSANARLHREMNTLVRWNSFPIVLRSGFTFRRVIRSALGTLILSALGKVKKGIERLYRYIHPTRAIITVATRCYGQSVGASLKSFHGCCDAAALIPVVFIESPVATVAFKSHR